MKIKIRIFFIDFVSKLYKTIFKPIFFLIDPEKVHESISSAGEFFGKVSFVKRTTGSVFKVKDRSLEQSIAGIDFKSPVGLAAGFDYEAKLTQFLPALGFGFETVGTITNSSYEGNPKPLLGRLPRSRSLMVNKGFKNLGAKKTIEKLEKLKFDIPIGISIGRTNSRKLITQQESVEDVVNAFTLFEKSSVNNSYYELNISCPNLFGEISFYPKKNLRGLLTEIEKLRLKKPIFIKMPIEKTDTEVLEMLDVIANFSIKGIIFGNLQKNRKDPALNVGEVEKFKVGNFSGKPTEKRSNELIKLAYKKYKKKLVIIGCGGIFSAEDAYQKIRLGASLVQLITGLIFRGPQLVSEINLDLIKLLKRDGFKNISEASGSV